MLELGQYHDNIVNLQGVSYELEEERRNMVQVRIIINAILLLLYLDINKFYKLYSIQFFKVFIASGVLFKRKPKIIPN